MPPPDEFYDYEYDDWPRDPRGPPPPPPGPMRGRGPPPPDFHGGDDYDHYRNAEERRRYMELEVALAKVCVMLVGSKCKKKAPVVTLFPHRRRR